MIPGYISFDRLFQYIKGYTEIPHKDDAVFTGYKNLYLQLIVNVADISGWYAWVKIQSNVKKQVVYIGQSQTRNTSSLKARLKEEFLDEYVALWATIHGQKSVETLIKKYSQYETGIIRAARKSGSTHIIWFGQTGLTDDQLNYVENKLIEIAKPLANKRKPKYMQEYPSMLEKAYSTLNQVLLGI